VEVSCGYAVNVSCSAQALWLLWKVWNLCGLSAATFSHFSDVVGCWVLIFASQNQILQTNKNKTETETDKQTNKQTNNQGACEHPRAGIIGSNTYEHLSYPRQSPSNRLKYCQ
jgi:hypothetical protein